MGGLFKRFTFIVKHKSSVINMVVDALSKQRGLLNKIYVEVPSFNSFADLRETDPYFSRILAKVRVGEEMEYLLQDGFLFRGNQLCIPNCSL